MKYKFVSPSRHDKSSSSMGGRRSVDRGGSVSGGKHNKCTIFPSRVNMVAEAIERINQNWIVRTKVASDLIIQIGDSIFQLHKVPMVSRSGYLNRLVFQRISIGAKNNNVSKIHVHNFPGGPEIFELVVKFCYGWKIDLTATNIAALYSAAHFLEMTDDLEQGNLISKTDTFLTFILFTSWKDIFHIFKSCETISSSIPKELKILKRCSEAIAFKASLDPKTFTSDNVDDHAFFFDNAQPNNGSVPENWWFEDVSSLRIDHFLQVVESIKTKGIKSELVGSCIAHWTAKWISQIPFGKHNFPIHLKHQLLRVTAESLIKVLPEEKNSVSCNFLLHLLKLGMMMRINFELSNKLEQRIALMVEQCSASDLLVSNYDSTDTVYDVRIVARVMKSYVSSVLSKPAAQILVVGRLVDGYLTMVARDEKLSVNQFQLLAEMLPKDARYCDDNLYRAIDMYLKAHPNLTEEERTSVYRAMDYHKLSQEARRHAMKNDRLPLYISMRLILLEQVNMAKSMIATGSNFRRTKTQTIIRVSKGFDKGCITPQKEIKMMKKEVENMKEQLNALQKCKMQLQRQVKGCSI